MNEFDFVKTVRRIDARLDHIESMLKQVVEDHEIRLERVELKTEVLTALRD